MEPKVLLDKIIIPTQKKMGGNYNTNSSQLLLLGTAAIESECGFFIQQIDGPALGPWQVEPKTEVDIWKNCDALKKPEFVKIINYLGAIDLIFEGFIYKPSHTFHMARLKYAFPYNCAMARLKYAMDPNALPTITGDLQTDMIAFYVYYKRVYNTEFGASTFKKWESACLKHRVFDFFEV